MQATFCSLYRNRLMGSAVSSAAVLAMPSAVPAGAHAGQWVKTSVKGIDPTPLIPEGGATG